MSTSFYRHHQDVYINRRLISIFDGFFLTLCFSLYILLLLVCVTDDQGFQWYTVHTGRPAVYRPLKILQDLPVYQNNSPEYTGENLLINGINGREYSYIPLETLRMIHLSFVLFLLFIAQIKYTQMDHIAMKPQPLYKSCHVTTNAKTRYRCVILCQLCTRSTYYDGQRRTPGLRRELVVSVKNPTLIPIPH